MTEKLLDHHRLTFSQSALYPGTPIEVVERIIARSGASQSLIYSWNDPINRKKYVEAYASLIQDFRDRIEFEFVPDRSGFRDRMCLACVQHVLPTYEYCSHWRESPEVTARKEAELKEKLERSRIDTERLNSDEHARLMYR